MMARFIACAFYVVVAAFFSATAAPTRRQTTGEWITGGFGTFFEQDGFAGSCGNRHSDRDLIASVDVRRMPANNFCGRQVLVRNTNNGKTVVATVADTCYTCINANSLDLSHGAFEALASLADGTIPIEYEFL